VAAIVRSRTCFIAAAFAVSAMVKVVEPPAGTVMFGPSGNE
jgi:hypothetical protein